MPNLPSWKDAINPSIFLWYKRHKTLLQMVTYISLKICIRLWQNIFKGWVLLLVISGNLSQNWCQESCRSWESWQTDLVGFNPNGYVPCNLLIFTSLAEKCLEKQKGLRDEKWVREKRKKARFRNRSGEKREKIKKGLG